MCRRPRFLGWCQGKVKSVIRNESPGEENQTKHPEVKIERGEIPDVSGLEKCGTNPQLMKDYLFNKDREGAWRTDVDLEEDRNNDIDDDGKVESGDEDCNDEESMGSDDDERERE